MKINSICCDAFGETRFESAKTVDLNNDDMSYFKDSSSRLFQFFGVRANFALSGSQYPQCSLPEWLKTNQLQPELLLFFHQVANLRPDQEALVNIEAELSLGVGLAGVGESQGSALSSHFD